MKSKLLVSACLMGFQVRYNGSEKAQLVVTLFRWQQTGWLVTHCPELVIGLSTPRLPVEIVGGIDGDVLAGRVRIVESDDRDVMGHYQLVAWLAFSAAREASCQAALLIDGSPICGSQFVYDGSSHGRRRAGAEVATDLLRAHGATVFSDGQVPQLLAWMAQRGQDDDSMQTSV